MFRLQLDFACRIEGSSLGDEWVSRVNHIAREELRTYNCVCASPSIPSDCTDHSVPQFTQRYSTSAMVHQTGTFVEGWFAGRVWDITWEANRYRLGWCESHQRWTACQARSRIELWCPNAEYAPWPGVPHHNFRRPLNLGCHRRLFLRTFNVCVATRLGDSNGLGAFVTRDLHTKASSFSQRTCTMVNKCKLHTSDHTSSATTTGHRRNNHRPWTIEFEDWFTRTSTPHATEGRVHYTGCCQNIMTV